MMNRRLTLRDIAGKKSEEAKETEKPKEEEKPERSIRSSRREEPEPTSTRSSRREEKEPEDNKKPVRTARISNDDEPNEERSSRIKDNETTEDSSESVDEQIEKMRSEDPSYLKIGPPGSGGKNYVELPEDEIFDCVIEDMKEMEMYNRFKKKATKKIKIIFSIIDDKDYEGCKASCLVTKSIHEKSTLFEVLQTIFGEDVDVSKGYDARDLIGEKCRIKIKNKFKEDAKNEGEKRVFPTVVQILPYSKSKNR